MQNIHVIEQQNNRKPTPQSTKSRLDFQYTPSPDGIDTNLLILLHGLGDTLRPFASLGQKLELPQTAIMAIQAPEPIPFMEGKCFQWFPSFNPLTGEELPSGHPEQRKGLLKTRKLIEELVRHVMDYCHFDARHIFFFGFSQGGTVALDQLLEGEIRNFGGAISVSGYPMALSDISNKERIPYDGPILITQGEKDPVIGPKQQAEKMFDQVKKGCSPNAHVEHLFVANKGHSMPVSQIEWRSIHSFFASQMPRRNMQLESMSDVYEIQPGGNV